MTPTPPVAPSGNRTLLILLVVGFAGLCLVGSCLVFVLGVGLTADDASTAQAAPAEQAGSQGNGSAYDCMATALVRVCMGPNNCSLRSANGYGLGDTMSEARQMAMTACNGQVGAMGGGGVCTATCTQKK